MFLLWNMARASFGDFESWGFDYAAYHEAAQRLVATGSPYQSETLGGPFRPGPGGLYLYPPMLAVAAIPLTLLDIELATTLWFVARLTLFGATIALLPVAPRVRLAALAAAAFSKPFVDDLEFGNVSLIVTFLTVVTWRWLDRAPGAAGLALAVCLRPVMGVFALWALMRGQLRFVAWTVVALVVLVVATLPFVGLSGYVDLLTVLRNVSDVTGAPRNVDLGSAVLMVGGSHGLAQLVLIGGYVLAASAVLLSFRRDRETSFIVTVGATLLLSPLMWHHYLTQLIVPAAFLADRGRPWALLLPILVWLPWPLVPLLAVAAVALPFLTTDRGAPTQTMWRRIRPPAQGLERPVRLEARS